jgi:hypothetical protein
MKKILQPNIIFIAGLIIYILSFILPTLRLSLDIKLSGWEAVALHFSEFAFINSVSEYFSFLFSALSNFWIVGLIVGFLIGRNTTYLILLSVLALLSSISWFFTLEHTSVLLVGYYVWLLSIILIIIARFMKKPDEELEQS